MALGISMYPNSDNEQEILEYLDVAAKYKVKRIFTNLLEATESEEVLIERFFKINSKARSLGMEVIIDVAPSLFEQFNISYDNLEFFTKLNVDGIRLDEGFNGVTEAMMTRNQYGLSIEINASIYSSYINQIIDNKPNLNKLMTCHNFYPLKYSALSLDYYKKCSEKYKSLGLRVATFVTSQNESAYGVWADSSGTPTLEYQRYLPLEMQYRHLQAIGLTDDIIISNCFATVDELRAISKIASNSVNFKVDLNDNLQDIEKEIMYNHKHFVRPDLSSHMFRSTIPRLTYKNEHVLPNNVTKYLEKGDVVVLNDNAGRYKGELHIVTKNMENDGSRNHLGKILEDDIFLLEFLDSNAVFNFIN